MARWKGRDKILTDEEVRNIMVRYWQGHESKRTLREEYKVRQGIIDLAIKGATVVGEPLRDEAEKMKFEWYTRNK